MGKNFSRKAFFVFSLLWPSALVAQSQTPDVAERADAEPSNFEYSAVKVRVRSTASGTCQFAVEHKGARETKHFTMPSPDRLVIDFQGLRVNRSKELPLKTHPCVKAVRFGVQPAGTRVVFDLRIPASPNYQALVGENSFEANLSVGTSVKPSANSAVVKPAEAKRVEEKKQAEQEPPKAKELTPQKEGEAKPSAEKETATKEDLQQDTSESSSSLAPATPVLTSSPESPEAPAQVPQIAEPELKIVGEPVLKFKIAQVFVALGADRRAVEDISVTNISEERLNMTAQVRKLLDAGLPTEREVETKEMLVSPMFFSLDPGAERQVRIVSVSEAGNSEAAYRVRFAPQRGGFEPVATLNMGEARARLNVITALSVLVVRAPEERSGELVSIRREGGILLRNESNQSLGLSEVKLCETRSRSNCREVPGRRLFSGNEWFIDSLGQGTLEFLKRSSSDFEMVVLEGEAR